MLCEAAVLLAVAQCTKEWGQNIWLELVCVLVISQQRASEYNNQERSQHPWCKV